MIQCEESLNILIIKQEKEKIGNKNLRLYKLMKH